MSGIKWELSGEGSRAITLLFFPTLNERKQSKEMRRKANQTFLLMQYCVVAKLMALALDSLVVPQANQGPWANNLTFLNLLWLSSI